MFPLTNTPGAAIYVRGSATDPQDQMRQEAECYQYAGQHGMAVSPEYVYYEEANTGEHWSDRPAYSALLLDAMRGKFSALIVSDRDVLESNPDTLEQLSTTLATNGVTLYSVH